MARNGWGIYDLMAIRVGIYGLDGWGSYGKVSCCFVRLPWLHKVHVSLPFHVAMKQAWFTLIQAWNRNT